MIETLANPEKEADSPGTAVVDFLAGKGATVVVAEGVGPEIVEVMKGKGIKAVSFKGSAEEAVKKQKCLPILKKSINEVLTCET